MELFRLFGSVLIDDKEAIKALGTTQKEAKNVAKAMDDLGTMAGKAGKAIAVGIGAGAAAIGGLVMKTTESLDRIDKLSQKIGMSRKAFQEWDYVLGQNGISIEVLQGGFKTMTNLVDDLMKGGKGATDSFGKLGLSADKLRGKTQDEIFSTVISELQKMPEGVERAALANDLLGRSASELAPLLNAGADATEELKNRASELGLIMDDETIAAGVKFNDTMDDIKRSLGAAAMQIGAQFIPKAQAMLDWVMLHMPTIQATFEVVLNAVASVLGWVGDNINILLPLLAGMLAGFIAFKVVSTIITIFTLFKTIIGAGSVAMGIFNAVMAANPAILIALAIGVLIAAVGLLWMNWDKVSKWLKESFKGVGNMFIGMVNMVINGMNAMIKGFLSPINLIIKGFNATIGKLTGKIPEISISIPNIPKLAMGGLVYGDSLVNVGEYAGARSNPEVIAPLDKLKDYMNNEIDYKRLAYELKNAISGMSVVLDDRKVGEFVDYRIVKGVL
jgi:hypothetical protein